MFNVPASDLWVVIQEPGNMPAWNSKCVSASHTHGAGLGSKFEASFTMGRTVQNSKGEVVGWERGREIKFRYIYESESRKDTSVEETYTITALGDHVSRLDHVVDLSNSGLPWWVQTLASFLSRFGRSTGPGPLEGIEELVHPR